MQFSKRSWALGAFLSAAIPACVTRGAPILDQSYVPPTNLAAEISEGYRYVGQTVTAGLTGYLSRADLGVYATGQPTPYFEVDVESTANGVPTGTILSQQDVLTTAAAGPTPGVPLEVIFSSPAFIPAGSQFALVVQAPEATPGAGNAVGGWSGSTTQDYPGGADYFSQDNISFNSDIGDLAFQTYVTQVPEPTCALTAVAIGGLVLTGRSRRPSQQARPC